MYVLTAGQMREADTRAIQELKIPSLTLMENAAARVAEIILRKNAGPSRTLVVCGKGNNGGDGLAIARILKRYGWNVKVLLIGQSDDLKEDPAENWARALAAAVPCTEDPDGFEIEREIAESELIVDALFGTGLVKPLTDIHSSVVQKINRSGKEVVSVDVPSGLSSDSGLVLGPAIKATTTVALAALKHCHIVSPASKMCGEIHVVDIGIPAGSAACVVRSSDIRPVLPHRSADSHKGAFGHSVIIAGSMGKTGAAYLSAKSALRCGAGLVTIACPSAVQAVVAAYGPEIMTVAADDPSDAAVLLLDKTAVAIGPGLGTSDEARQLVQSVVAQYQGPLVIDADGLNHIAQDLKAIENRRISSTILTPHPGEMARLLNTDTATVQKQRQDMAQKLASLTGAVVVLKGYRTVVAHPEGKLWIVLTGGHALASAGTGDVLTGIITGFLSQRLKPLEAALAGVYLHGLTSNLFERKYPQQGMNALDVLDWWNEAVHIVRSGRDIESEYLKIHFEF